MILASSRPAPAHTCTRIHTYACTHTGRIKDSKHLHIRFQRLQSHESTSQGISRCYCEQYFKCPNQELESHSTHSAMMLNETKRTFMMLNETYLSKMVKDICWIMHCNQYLTFLVAFQGVLQAPYSQEKCANPRL